MVLNQLVEPFKLGVPGLPSFSLKSTRSPGANVVNEQEDGKGKGKDKGKGKGKDPDNVDPSKIGA